MHSLDEVTGDGVVLPERAAGLEDVGPFSLKAAWRSFFSTYQAMKYSLHVFERDVDDETDKSHERDYYDAYSETIYHFHHFIELALRRLLRDEHPLLAADARAEPALLHRLLKNEPVDPADFEKVRAPNMSEILKTICSLLSDGRMDADRLGFILENRSLLERLSGLRNRLSHRGSFILKYPALDELVGGYLSPFLAKLVALDEFSGKDKTWRYRQLECGVDPIEQIMKCVTKGYELRKVAYLKELGRAAYYNPLRGSHKAPTSGIEGGIYLFFDRPRIERAQNAAKAELGNGDVVEVKTCPVCGVESLCVYDSIETEGEELIDGQLTYDKAWRYTWQVECLCCTFRVDYHLDNASTYSLPIEDYWTGKEL